MKQLIYTIAIGCMVLFTAISCKDMDDNYREYLDNVPTYAPAVRNLRAVSSVPGNLTLMWDIVDDTHLIKSMRIVVKKTATDTRTIEIPEVVTEYTVTDLELQGYEFEVFTIDGFGNLSKPVIETFTPIPGRE
ncbi:MAG: hypothetical protein IJM04_13325 [Prevotella sp.]|nr:hypothetical protein [Prevotella sp.]